MWMVLQIRVVHARVVSHRSLVFTLPTTELHVTGSMLVEVCRSRSILLGCRTAHFRAKFMVENFLFEVACVPRGPS